MDRPYQWHQWMLHGREEDSPSPHSLFWRQCVMVSRDPEKNLNTRKKTSQFRSLAHCGSCRGFGTREHNHLIQGNKGCLYYYREFCPPKLKGTKGEKVTFSREQGNILLPQGDLHHRFSRYNAHNYRYMMWNQLHKYAEAEPLLQKF